jgi:hypothetical protein
MKEFRWNTLKSQRLKRVRGVSFEELVNAEIITFWKHPKRERQSIMFFYHKNYIWMAPYVEEEDYIFLKTLYASRKFTKLYRRGELK